MDYAKAIAGCLQVFRDAGIDPPPRNPDDTDEDYLSRLLEYGKEIDAQNAAKEEQSHARLGILAVIIIFAALISAD